MHDEYHISRIIVYARFDLAAEADSLESWLAGLERMETLSEEEEEESYVKAFGMKQKIAWLEVSLGMSVLQLLQMPHHLIIGGIVHLIVLVQGNEAHRHFVRGVEDRGETISVIDPVSGKLIPNSS